MAGLVESKKGGGFALIFGGILLTADAFGLDLTWSPHLAIGVPYALVVVLGLWWKDRSYIFTAAIVGSLFCLLGLYFSFSSDQLWIGIANRGFAIFLIWMVAALCLFYKKEKIEKLALLRRNDLIGQETLAVENSLKESQRELQNLEKASREKLQNLEKENLGRLQGMEKDTAILRLKILEKEALLDRLEEEFLKVKNTLKEQEDRLVAIAEHQGKEEEAFDRLQESLNRLQDEKMTAEERLRDKDALIAKAEEDRNRTAGALWEKEQQLGNVLENLSLLEKDLQDKVELMACKDEELKQVQGLLHERDDNLRSVEVRLTRTQEKLTEKERDLKRLELNMLAMESQLQVTKNTLEDRDGLLEKIETQIHESLKKNSRADSQTKPDRITLEPKEKPPRPMTWDPARQPQGLHKNPDPQVEPYTPDLNFEQRPEKENGNNTAPAWELTDEKVKNRFLRYARELERSNEDLKEFASIASHDLQEPLRKIMSFGMRLKKDCSPQLDDRGKDYLERMERSAQRMQKFINDLLQYSKITPSSTRRQSVDLNEVISQVLIVLESRIEQTHPMIEVDPLPVIEADRMQMTQLFQNLISNALKFHKKGDPPAIRIIHRLLPDESHEIRVEDRGIGFDENFLNRIFKPFERLHSKSEYEGTGMGLAICQKIVLRHGGQLTAESSPQKGATFIITLPPATRR